MFEWAGSGSHCVLFPPQLMLHLRFFLVHLRGWMDPPLTPYKASPRCKYSGRVKAVQWSKRRKGYILSSFVLKLLWAQKNAFFTTGEALGAMEWRAKVQLKTGVARALRWLVYTRLEKVSHMVLGHSDSDVVNPTRSRR